MKRKFWTIQELNLLKKEYGKIYAIEIAKALDRTKESIICKATKLGLISGLSKKGRIMSDDFKRKRSIYMKEARADLNSSYNSEEYRKKQSLASKLKWKHSVFDKEERNRKIGLIRKGKTFEEIFF